MTKERILEILEGAKDETASVPMSLVRKAFENISNESNWISCKERLPESYVDVLVWFEYYRYGSYNRLYQTYGIGTYSENYDSWTINHESGWHKLRVIAWQPLPERYREEGGEE